MKIALKLCRTARENPLRSQKGCHRRARPLTLVVLVAVLVCFSPCHLTIIRFMLREMLHPPSCPEQRALSLQLTMPLMNMNGGADPIIYFFASTRYRKWLLSFLKLRASASSSSPTQGKASSETRSINQAGGSVPLEENKV
ncbi:LOW QUALITY PROTEIN: G-protein coupled receptor 183-like [Prionailurus bengalensis]|uniref:LOW QUALITY PROTEIN: G-protein coupled receptor 183-like n=1 Tax=Prionailurus bengalensis TaxID=37029 RepID=UPI001CA88CB3|nr:LOW QUALITY PROTEIN: G-protein coupled receptor 183-like [Prionailurus bengalensis]